MSSYATVSDLEAIWRELDEDEQEMATVLLSDASSIIRIKAKGTGRDFDAMLEGNADLASVAKTVVCAMVRRYMNAVGSNLPAMSQFSQSAGGYSVSGTFAVPEGGMYLMNNEAKALGLRRAMIGSIPLCSLQ